MAALRGLGCAAGRRAGPGAAPPACHMVGRVPKVHFLVDTSLHPVAFQKSILSVTFHSTPVLDQGENTHKNNLQSPTARCGIAR